MKKGLLCVLIFVAAGYTMHAEETANHNAITYNIGQTVCGRVLWADKEWVFPLSFEHTFSKCLTGTITVTPKYADDFDTSIAIGTLFFLPDPWTKYSAENEPFRRYIGVFPLYDFSFRKLLTPTPGKWNGMTELGCRNIVTKDLFVDIAAGIELTNIELYGNGFQPFFLILNLSIGSSL